jgi:hypothetical protein
MGWSHNEMKNRYSVGKTRKGTEKKAEEPWTHTWLIMTLLLLGFAVVEGKTRRCGGNIGRACSDRGGFRKYHSRARAQQAAQPHFNHSDTSKRTLKITTKIKEENNDQRRHKNLTMTNSNGVSRLMRTFTADDNII